MLRPSYSDLMEALNEQGNIDSDIASRYTIVIAAATRARQLIDGSKKLVTINSDKPVSVAVSEMFEGHMKISAGEKQEKVVREHADIEWEPDEDYN